MKSRLLALTILATILVGCGDDSSTSASQTTNGTMTLDGKELQILASGSSSMTVGGDTLLRVEASQDDGWSLYLDAKKPAKGTYTIAAKTLSGSAFDVNACTYKVQSGTMTITAWATHSGKTTFSGTAEVTFAPTIAITGCSDTHSAKLSFSKAVYSITAQ